MGPEILVYFVAALGLAAFLRLCIHSARQATRVYALPTLLASTAAALALSNSVPAAHFAIWFLLYFVPCAAVFTGLAVLIRWVVGATSKWRKTDAGRDAV
ncbi:hypothetical protein AE621_13295 [Acidovorax sp. SD340]|jgi:hypothetical protein|nr:hypothetical protein AE621_13295 [Acidovorax sp. SD340]